MVRGPRHNIQRAYEVLRRRCQAPTAYGLCSPKAILLPKREALRAAETGAATRSAGVAWIVDILS